MSDTCTLKVGLFQEVTESTVATVKALLAATKAERSKRGKYFKYSQELKEEIAAFALVLFVRFLIYSSTLVSATMHS